MVTLFDQEKIMEIHDYHIAETARKDGIQEGMVEGLLKALKNLIKNSGVTVDEAMSMLGISKAERFQYVEKLKQ